MSDEEMKNYLSVIIREVGEMRKDFVARFEKLEERMSGLEVRMGGLEASMSEMKIDMREMRKDFRAMSVRFDRLGSVVLETRADVSELQDRVTVVEGGHVGDKLR